MGYAIFCETVVVGLTALPGWIQAEGQIGCIILEKSGNGNPSFWRIAQPVAIVCWLGTYIRAKIDTRNRLLGDLHDDYHWQSHEEPSYPRAA
jgi:hypothetical protein